MHPLVGGDLSCLGQFDHSGRWRVARRAAGPAPQRSFQLPERRLRTSADGVKTKIAAHLTARALDFQPAESAVDALADRRGGLCGASKAFHADRPGLGLGSVGFANGRLGALASSLGSDLRAMIRPPQITSRDLVLMSEDSARRPKTQAATSCEPAFRLH